MTKNVKMLLCYALVVGVGYYFWKKSQAPATASFANAEGKWRDTCGCDKGSEMLNGKRTYMCGDGKSSSYNTNGKCK